MENEENRGLVNKKASEDQLVPFVSSVLELSFYSLSHTLLDTQILLGALQQWNKKSKYGEGKQGSSKEEQDQAAKIGLFAGINFHV